MNLFGLENYVQTEVLAAAALLAVNAIYEYIGPSPGELPADVLCWILLTIVSILIAWRYSSEDPRVDPRVSPDWLQSCTAVGITISSLCASQDDLRWTLVSVVSKVLRLRS
jgi:hypothetical protein